MNKNQVKGAAKEAAGVTQAKAGKLVGSTTQRAKGNVRALAGKAQRKLGDAEQAQKDSQRRM